MSTDFDKRCAKMSTSELKKLPEYRQIPKDIDKSKLTTQELCKIINVIHQSNREGTSRQFFELVRMLGGKSQPIQSQKIYVPPEDCNAPSKFPKKFIRIIKPSRKLYHGRSVTKGAGIWESEKDFRKIMWWAVEKITPLMYASTSIKGRSLDPFYRWDVYEARVKQELPFLVMNKNSVEHILNTPEIANVKCEGKTVGKWLKKAFPIKKGKIHRRSHIDTDRKMAVCLCSHLHCVGYIADEIDVADGPGKLHKEVLVCVPQDTLILKKYMSFSSKRGQRSVEQYLNERSSKLLPDEVNEY